MNDPEWMTEHGEKCRDYIETCSLCIEATLKERDALKLQNGELQKDVTSMKVAVRMHQTAEKKLDEMLKESNRLNGILLKAVTSISLRRCCDEVCFHPCSSDVAALALKEVQQTEKRIDPSPKKDDPPRKCNEPWSPGHSEFSGR